MALSAVAIGLMTAEGRTRPRPADAESYHQRVAEVAETMPEQIGEWLGQRIEVPDSAVELLRPNVLMNYGFQNRITGEDVSLLFVQCKDAQDMAGHYPPRCYTGVGYAQTNIQQREWVIDGLVITGKQYEYERTTENGLQRVVVQNFMLLPDGQIAADMDAVFDAVGDFTKFFYGAGQVQVITSAGMSDADRDAVFHELVGAYLPLIRTTLNGLSAEEGH